MKRASFALATLFVSYSVLALSPPDNSSQLAAFPMRNILESVNIIRSNTPSVMTVWKLNDFKVPLIQNKALLSEDLGAGEEAISYYNLDQKLDGIILFGSVIDDVPIINAVGDAHLRVDVKEYNLEHGKSKDVAGMIEEAAEGFEPLVLQIYIPKAIANKQFTTNIRYANPAGSSANASVGTDKNVLLLSFDHKGDDGKKDVLKVYMAYDLYRPEAGMGVLVHNVKPVPKKLVSMSANGSFPQTGVAPDGNGISTHTKYDHYWRSIYLVGGPYKIEHIAHESGGEAKTNTLYAAKIDITFATI